MKNFCTVIRAEVLRACKSVRTNNVSEVILGNCSVGNNSLNGVKVTYESKTYYLKSYCLHKETYTAVRGFGSAKALADFLFNNQR